VTHVDLFFGIQGESVPLDHGFELSSAISRTMEEPCESWFHETKEVGLIPIRGTTS
jgi:hypothetical protein